MATFLPLLSFAAYRQPLGKLGIVNALIIAAAGVIVAIAAGAFLIIHSSRPRPSNPSAGAPAKAQSVLGNGAQAAVSNATPTPKINAEQLEESRSLLFRLISELGTTIQQLMGVAATYDAGLAEYENKLSQSSKREDIQLLCREILTELHDMRAANARYKAELADTQRKLRERESEVASLQLDMNTDYLTRILNRRGLEARLQEEIARAKRYDTPLSIAMFDIDLFKEVNDEHGHEAGDKVLRLVAHTLEELKRTNDAAGRYGGEEFMLLLPSASAEQALVVAERARRQMERFVTRFNDARIRVTMSGGVAQLDPESDSLDALLRRADKALYAAKTDGRNKVVSA